MKIKEYWDKHYQSFAGIVVVSCIIIIFATMVYTSYIRGNAVDVKESVITTYEGVLTGIVIDERNIVIELDNETTILARMSFRYLNEPRVFEIGQEYQITINGLNLLIDMEQVEG